MRIPGGKTRIVLVVVAVLLGACGVANEVGDSAAPPDSSMPPDSSSVVDTSTPPPDSGAMDAGGCGATPERYDFGSVMPGSRSAPQTFCFENTRTETSGTLAVSASRDSTQFLIAADGCSGARLAPGASCAVDVVYAPTAAGSHAADLLVSSSPGGTVSVELLGTAVISDPFIDPSSRDFGTVTVGATSAGSTFTLTNTSSAPGGPLTAEPAGTDAGDFAIVSNSCGTPIASGASCTIEVVFRPLTSGAKSATLDVTDGTLFILATLTGTATDADCEYVTPSTHDFGLAAVGTSTSETVFTLLNPGGSPVGPVTAATSGANPADFPIGADSCGDGIPPGGSCTISVAFRPTTGGARSATLTVHTAGGCVVTAALSGRGT